METPSSVRRVTRSQTVSAQKESSPMKGKSIQAKQDRAVLFDITNDSPIAGLATRKVSNTPSSSVTKNGSAHPLSTRTPGSGEALLRGQVKTLLQKVEEESEFVKPPSSVAPFQMLLTHLRSPRGLLAPTPANTPQVFHGQGESPFMGIPSSLEQVSVAASVRVREEQVECQTNRELLFDSPEKSDTSAASSSLTYQGSTCSFPEKFSEDDCSSLWSIQVNVGSQKGEEEEEDGDDAEWGDEEQSADGVVDELCEGFGNMMVMEEKSNKHVRFLYDSGDEMEGEEEVGGVGGVRSPSVLVLKGLPVPEGKHLRFHEDE